MRLGLEADYAEGHEAELETWLERADWDLVLGSVHWVGGDWIDDPGRSPARFEREGTEALYDEYYRLLAKAARTGLFDVLTHFDLPKKHGHRPAAPRTRAEEEAIAAAKDAGVRRRDLLGRSSEARRGGLSGGAAFSRGSSPPGFPSRSPPTRTLPPRSAGATTGPLALARGAGVSEFVTFERRRKIPRPLPR